MNEGFFTFGILADSYQLPHPPIDIRVILLVRRVLIRAFELLREQANINLATATEDEITAALRSVVENNLRKSGEVHGFNTCTFESVVRQAQLENYNGNCLTKTPDLCFKLCDNEHGSRLVVSEFNGIFIEAKPVDSSHPVGSKYCNDGLIRFVRGDYAWAMQDGIMLAYSRNGRTIAGHLIPAMTEPTRMESLATIQPPECCSCGSVAATPAAETVHASRHRRNFEWRDGKGHATPITIYHLWHQCSG